MLAIPDSYDDINANNIMLMHGNVAKLRYLSCV